MQYEVCKLQFTTPLHIGRGAADLDKAAAIYHSDAMKSAMFAVGLPYYPHWQKEPDSFFNSFRISSLFPYSGDEIFMPKPYYQVRFKFAAVTEEKQPKKAKKISFLSAAVFKQWMQQKNAEIPVSETQVSSGGSYLFGAGTKAKAFLHTDIQQRVQVPAEDSETDTRPFYFDRLYFQDDAGLYFFAQFENDAIRQQVMHVMQLLGDAGIGTDRTVGNGLFSFKPDEHVSLYDFPEPKDAGLQMNLGLYLPTKKETEYCDFDKSSWQLVKRGGYMGGSTNDRFLSLRKNSIYFFAEGSTFAATQPLQGKFTNLQPAYNDPELHPVYRCGQPLFLTI